MGLWFAALLGVVQGLTEFIPVSSSAHLRLAAAWLGQPDAGAAVTAVLQLGTLLAVIAYFAADLRKLIGAALHSPTSPEARTFWFIGLATLPLAIAGVALQSLIIGELRRLEVVATALVGVGALMIAIDRRGGRDRGIADLRGLDVLLIGCAQAAALIPGVSRSGATICMALLLGMTRTEAARFSFLMSIPAVAGSGVFEIRDAMSEMHHLGGNPVPGLVLGTVISAIVGYASIAWFLRWLGNRRMTVFGVYRIALGAAVLAALATGVVRNDDRRPSASAPSHVKNSPSAAAP
jgi:undecaprenyl-diphosphatase